MSDFISKALLCGLGLASLTKETIQKTAEELVDQCKLSETEGRRLVKELQRRSTQAQKALEKVGNSAVHAMLKNLNLVAIVADRMNGAKIADTGGRKSPKSRARKAGVR